MSFGVMREVIKPMTHMTIVDKATPFARKEFGKISAGIAYLVIVSRSLCLSFGGLLLPGGAVSDPKVHRIND